ncbi:MAG: acyl-CoA thioesterase [Bacteroidales bacterium]|jgi:acyl-CoA thioester hydrolase|nr:4-hydroxybenzoyl-CoA thioesterase [Lentimicrobiaceae bacterium]MDG1136398.1 acyl-CoA thioesterase [Bacteroidales bacterium]MDG1902215.1 acyl-CoA thioesterase [Bacteroidales bacterium]MDG2080177.1 acyl-CoA thioesterase [Bacteroidales bacterium]|tara:strand:- start:13970 stop:14395 length:426 start_codon:yes stop_codon:yes gene_type:complete
MGKVLKDIAEVKVRFGEVDSMGIVWHGNYVKYIEEGRESFGRNYGISYLDIYSNNVMAPVVNMNIDFKKQVRYGDTLIVETEFVNTPSAKIIFDFRVYRKSDNELVATAQSTQVFIDMDHEMLLYPPDFAIAWKRKFGLIE